MAIFASACWLQWRGRGGEWDLKMRGREIQGGSRDSRDSRHTHTHTHTHSLTHTHTHTLTQLTCLWNSGYKERSQRHEQPSPHYSFCHTQQGTEKGLQRKITRVIHSFLFSAAFLFQRLPRRATQQPLLAFSSLALFLSPTNHPPLCLDTRCAVFIQCQENKNKEAKKRGAQEWRRQQQFANEGKGFK